MKYFLLFCVSYCSVVLVGSFLASVVLHDRPNEVLEIGAVALLGTPVVYFLGRYLSSRFTFTRHS
jgi:hypothetical protein